MFNRLSSKLKDGNGKQKNVSNQIKLIKGSLGIQLPTILKVAAEDLSIKRCDRADVIQQRCET